jgi:hypothetical protein
LLNYVVYLQKHNNMKTTDAIYKYVIGGLMVIGFFCSLVFMAFNNKNGEFTSLITAMSKTVEYSIILIVGYYWGSSAGSARKDELINDFKNSIK